LRPDILAAGGCKGAGLQKETSHIPDALDADSCPASTWRAYPGVGFVEYAGLFGDFFRGDRLAVSRNCSVVSSSSSGPSTISTTMLLTSTSHQALNSYRVLSWGHSTGSTYHSSSQLLYPAELRARGWWIIQAMHSLTID
jgi:hypothetical protein